jgi:hypothetical protein
MARVAIGKEPIDAKKEAGKMAKAFAAPYRAQKAVLAGLKKSVNKAIKSLETLESNVALRKAEQKAENKAAKKPSLLGQLKENLAVVEEAKREHRALEKVATKGAEL